jgi:hypothetical protein
MPPVQKKRLGSFSDANVLYFLTAFRICNALLIRTFFQPDEYFQSLEPAWDIAFGPASGAWITWVRSCFERVTGLLKLTCPGMAREASIFVASFSLRRCVSAHGIDRRLHQRRGSHSI